MSRKRFGKHGKNFQKRSSERFQDNSARGDKDALFDPLGSEGRDEYREPRSKRGLKLRAKEKRLSPAETEELLRTLLDEKNAYIEVLSSELEKAFGFETALNLVLAIEPNPITLTDACPISDGSPEASESQDDDFFEKMVGTNDKIPSQAEGLGEFLKGLYITWLQLDRLASGFTGLSFLGDEALEKMSQARARSLEARNALCLGHSFLVSQVKVDFISPSLGPEDLFQEGFIGLIHAAELIGLNRGVAFNAYAAHFIRYGKLTAVTGKGRLIKTPILFGRKINRFEKVKKHLDGIEPEPDLAAIARAMNVTIREAMRLYDYSVFGYMSLGEIVKIDGENALEAALFNNPQMSVLDRLIAREIVFKNRHPNLNVRQRRVLAEYCGFFEGEKSLAEIGCELGLSRERIRQILALALTKIRDAFAIL
jgi:RNA polymerase sigma factor (sigma-70 family)